MDKKSEVNEKTGNCVTATACIKISFQLFTPTINKKDLFNLNYFFPVEPKPPSPRTVSDSSSVSQNSAAKNGAITSCAIRSPSEIS